MSETTDTMPDDTNKIICSDCGIEIFYQVVADMSGDSRCADCDQELI